MAAPTDQPAHAPRGWAAWQRPALRPVIGGAT
jgi:hypothetical protein